MIRFQGLVPVDIHPLFFIIAALLGWLMNFSLWQGSLWMIIITFSILLHEYGHALSARFFGQRARIELTATGGLTYRDGGRLKLWKEFCIVACGPLMNIGICMAASLALKRLPPGDDPLHFFTELALNMNAVWAVINLVPVMPLDGGLLMSLLFESIFGLRGVKMSLWFSLFLSVAIGILFFKDLGLLSLFFLFFGMENWRHLQSLKYMRREDQDEILQKRLLAAQTKLLQGAKEEALPEFLALAKELKNGLIARSAAQTAAELLAERGQYQEGFLLLEPHRDELSGAGLVLFQRLSYHSLRYDLAAKAAADIVGEGENQEAFFIAALSCGRLGDADGAVGWLQAAERAGLDVKPLLKKEDFDTIRQSAVFQEYSGGGV